MDLFVNGLARGAIYALVALGYTMVYGILGMINFAHGDIFMIGMFAAVFAIGVLSTLWGPVLGVNLVIGAVLAILLAAAYGYANERIAYRRLRRAHILAPLTSAIGLSIVLQNFIWLSVSKDKIDFPRFDSGPLADTRIPLPLGAEASVSLLQAVILVSSLLLMGGLFLLIHRTRIGLAMRATAQDQRMAALVGVPVNKVIAFTFVLGSGLAAAAGVMVAMYQGVLRFDSGYSMGLKAFTAAILGGIGNIPGAVLGGFIIGMTEDLTSYRIGSDWKDGTTFLILMVVLILRPRGLLGERVAEKA
ncbi:MAG: branched-chain amino acid ABC transporter permease [Candidatus Methylacidiphilales bacterium]|nr:branched-chain amino acid ABC transporter permease [Candidatus Methylacidiphilales bacterium]